MVGQNYNLKMDTCKLMSKQSLKSTQPFENAGLSLISNTSGLYYAVVCWSVVSAVQKC